MTSTTITKQRRAATAPDRRKKMIAPERRVVPLPEPEKGFSFSFAPKRSIRDHMPNTKRARIIDLLRRPEGASFNEIQRATGWNRKDAYEGVRLVHYFVGYGLETDAKGRIRLVEPPSK